MSPQEFQTQMNRLAENFGKQAYGTERTSLIWKEVQHLSVEWFQRLVSDMIGTLRQAPLIPEFKDAAARERDHLWQAQKSQERQETRNWVSQFSSEEERMIAEAIRKRMMGALSDEEWSAVQRMIANVGKASA